MANKSSIFKQFVAFSFVLVGLQLVPFLRTQEPVKSPAGLPSIGVDNVAGDFRELARKADALERTPCNFHEWLNAPKTVAAFLGGEVKSIRVIRFVRVENSPNPIDVRNAISKVWLGQFQSASCYIDWAEGALWSIEAIVEFEDGKKASLITDGSHVAMQDHNGKTWFVRLLPAAQ